MVSNWKKNLDMLDMWSIAPESMTQVLESF